MTKILAALAKFFLTISLLFINSISSADTSAGLEMKKIILESIKLGVLDIDDQELAGTQVSLANENFKIISQFTQFEVGGNEVIYVFDTLADFITDFGDTGTIYCNVRLKPNGNSYEAINTKCNIDEWDNEKLFDE